MTSNGDKLAETLDNYINRDLKEEPRPEIEAIAIKMRDNQEFRVQMLGFWTLICHDCPSILQELNTIVLAMIIKDIANTRTYPNETKH